MIRFRSCGRRRRSRRERRARLRASAGAGEEEAPGWRRTRASRAGGSSQDGESRKPIPLTSTKQKKRSPFGGLFLLLDLKEMKGIVAPFA